MRLSSSPLGRLSLASPHSCHRTASTLVSLYHLLHCASTLCGCIAAIHRIRLKHSGVPHVSLSQPTMALDFSNSNLELQLEASLAQQEAQANETRALLAQIKQSAAQQQQQQHQQSSPGYSPSDATTFQYTPVAATSSTSSPPSSNAPTRHGSSRSVPSHGASRPHLGQPALVRTAQLCAQSIILLLLITGANLENKKSISKIHSRP